MDFRVIQDVNAARKDMLTQRLGQLEAEYLSNETALIVAQTLPVSDQQQEEIARLQTNMDIIEIAHTSVAAEVDAMEAQQAVPVEG